MKVNGYETRPEADLREANLVGADLSRADLREANLFGADLRRADLSRADLRRADLFGADLSEANLVGADLSRADLRRADLRRSDLFGADLSEADLFEADLREANLRGTCLDPTAIIPDATNAVLAAGMEIDGDGFVHAWRTRRSQHCGTTEYSPGRYTCPVFSIDVESDCHPGLYFASHEWLLNKYNGEPLVKVLTHVSTVVHAAGKFRTKELWVLGLDA